MHTNRLIATACSVALLAGGALVFASQDSGPAATSTMNQSTTEPTTQPTSEPTTKAGNAEEREGGVTVTTTRSADGMADRQAKEGDVLMIHYTGKFDDGTVFDTSLEPRRDSRKTYGEPIVIKLGRAEVIRGWEIGLEGIQVGEKRTLVIPPAMGYGNRDHYSIPANSTLTFDVECVGMYREEE